MIALTIFAVGALVHLARKLSSAPKARNVSRAIAALKVATASAPKLEPELALASASYQPFLAAPSAKAVWFPLPGNCLALGTTGFEISFAPENETGAFQLITPEGHSVCFSHNIDFLTAAGEHMARHREQFDVSFASSGVLSKAAGSDSSSV